MLHALQIILVLCMVASICFAAMAPIVAEDLGGLVAAIGTSVLFVAVAAGFGYGVLQVGDAIDANRQEALQIAFVQRSDTPAQDFVDLVDDGPADVRAEIAASANPAAVDAQLLLATDPHRSVREALAANIHAPQTVFVVLAADKDPDVREAVINNPAAPQHAAVAAVGWPTVSSASR